MIAPFALACVLSQDSKAKAPDAAVYDALVRKIDELKSFVAVYKRTSSNNDKVETIRIAYRAPNEVQFNGMGTRMTAEKGELTVLTSPPGGKGFWARAPAEVLQERRSRALTEAIAAEFAKDLASWAPTLDCGPFLQFKISTIDGGKHDQLGFTMTYDCPREPLFGWIETFKESSDVTPGSDADHLVMKTPRGSEVTLSTLTGFVEKMSQKDDRGAQSIVLETLDLHPKFEDSAFASDQQPDGMEDQSGALGSKIGRGVTHLLEQQFAAWLSTRVSSGMFRWDADAREHARRVLEALFSESIASDNEAWQSVTKAWIGTFGESLRQKYHDAGKGSDAIAAIEGTIRERRGGIVEALKGFIQHRPPSTLIGSKEVPDAERFGVAEVAGSRIVGIEEKPRHEVCRCPTRLLGKHSPRRPIEADRVC
jgi:hypothetical protein